jgi:hypothetical protein
LHGVVARAGIDKIIPGAADDRVTTRPGIDKIIASVTDQRVVTGQTGNRIRECAASNCVGTRRASETWNDLILLPVPPDCIARKIAQATIC